MAVLLDTSALAKLYHQEAGTAFVRQILIQQHGGVLLLRLAVLEMHSVIAGKVRSGEVQQEDSDVIRLRFRSDVRKRRFHVVSMRSRHYELAEILLNLHGATRGLRALDALQLAVALDLQRAGEIEAMVTADRVLLRIAVIEELPTVNPETAA